jgi:hypothetical protein
VLFVERPYLPDLVSLARAQQVSVACVANWEWLNANWKWLNLVDLMICPTRFTYRHLSDWKRRYGFGWELVYVAWPIDCDRFAFRQRNRCERFVFVNGWGGGRPRSVDGSRIGYRRKGFALIAEAARLAAHLPWLIYSQDTNLPPLPSHCEVRPAPVNNARLYELGDVCVQPSHWEGLGLQLLECQAAGMPLVTTDAPPMNEHRPLRTIPVAGTEVITLGQQLFLSSQWMNARDLVAVLEGVHGMDLHQASRQARDFVEQEHSWSEARSTLLAKLATHCASHVAT